MVQCCDITTAQLNTLITIERRTRTADGMGGWTESWVADPVGGVWAKPDHLSGTERFEAGRIESTNLINFFIRYKADANGAPYYQATETRIICRGRYYNVLSVVDLDLQKKWLRIFAQEGDIW